MKKQGKQNPLKPTFKLETCTTFITGNIAHPSSYINWGSLLLPLLQKNTNMYDQPYIEKQYINMSPAIRDLTIKLANQEFFFFCAGNLGIHTNQHGTQLSDPAAHLSTR